MWLHIRPNVPRSKYFPPLFNQTEVIVATPTTVVTIPALNMYIEFTKSCRKIDAHIMAIHEECMKHYLVSPDHSLFQNPAPPKIILLCVKMLQKVDDPFTAATKEKKRNDATCFSPLCWFRKGRSRARMNLDELCAEEAEDDHIDLGYLNSESSSSNSTAPGIDKKEASLSLGVGFGLMYLMAASSNEMKKVAEMCKQMESMLQTLRRELPNGQAINENCTPKSQLLSNYPADDHVSIQDSPSYSDSDFTSSSYQNSHSKLRKRKGKNLEMDQLESELETELENLQLHLDDEVMLNHSNHKHSQGVPEGLEMENKNYENGVHPRELERRLHELIESRQEERIRELEIALQNATKNINDNQQELCWWRDTAKIIFQNSPL